MKAAVLAIAAAGILLAAGAYIVITDDGGKRECDVAVTMGWQKEIIDTLTNDRLDTVVLMDPNTSPHESRSTVSSIEYLHNAKLFIEIGSGVEWEVAMLDSVRADMTTETVSCMDLIETYELAHPEEFEGHDHEEEEHDHGEEEHSHGSHIWMNPQNLGIIAKELAPILKEKFPETADEIGTEGSDADEGGLAGYIARVNGISDRIRGLVEGDNAIGSGQTVFVWHNAYDPLIEFINSQAHTEDSDFIHIVSGEDMGAGDTPSVSDVMKFMTAEDAGKIVYVSPFDAGSQQREELKNAGYEVIDINPTAAEFLTELDELIGSWEKNLAPAA